MGRLSESTIADVDFSIVKAQQVEDSMWRTVQNLHYKSYSYDLAPIVGEEGAKEFSKMGDPFEFRLSRVSPDRSPHLNKNNQYARPLAALAFSGDELVGYAYSVDNTSGKHRSLKMRIPPTLPVPKIGNKRYHWLREIVVDPDYRGNGIARVLGGLLLAQRNPSQITSTYTFPDVVPKEHDFLLEMGFTVADERLAAPFGRNTSESTAPNSDYPFFVVRQSKLVAHTGRLLRDLYNVEGVRAIVEKTKRP